MKNVFKSIWSFLTNKWVKRVMILILLISIGLASYQLGSYDTFKDLNQRLSFKTKDDDQIKQSDMTEILMTTKDGQKEYVNIVNALAMKASLEKDNIKIPQSRLVDYSQYDVQDFKQKNPKGSSQDFEVDSIVKYGSDDSYKLRSIMDVSRAMYAEKHYNYSDELNHRLNLLKDMKSYKVLMSFEKNNDKSKSETMTLTPYQFLTMFGENNLDKYKNVSKNDKITIQNDDSKVNIVIKNNGSSYTDKDVKKDMKNDTKFFLQSDIQEKMDHKIEKQVLKNNDLIEFTHPFDEETYKKGLKL